MGGFGTGTNKQTVVAPPDGGWGWMVVLGSFLIHVIADGITYSFGVMIQDLLVTFKESKGVTSWIISIMIAFTLGSGPIASAITNRFGCRKATMTGAVIAAFGSFLSYFATGIVYLYFSMGFVTGIGFGLMYCPAIIVVTVYFEKKRAFATGIAVCGAGIGTFLFAPFTRYLLETYTWRGTFLIYSGIILNCAVCGALFRDPPTKNISEYDEEGHRKRSAHHQQALLSTSMILDAIAEEDDESSQHVVATCVSAPESPEKNGVKTLMNGGQTSSESDVRWLKPGTMIQQEPRHMNPTLKVPPARSTSSVPSAIQQANGSYKTTALRQRGYSETTPHHGSHITSHVLNRKDIFYPGSVENLPEYKSNPDLYRSVTSLHRPLSVTEEAVVTEGLWDDIKESFLQMADIAVLKDPIFLIFAISNLFTSMGMNPPLVFLPNRAESMGIHGEEWLLSSFGIANTIGRLIIGYIADRRWANRLFIYNTCLTLCGIGTMLSFLCYSFQMLAAYAAFYGLSLSAYISLTSVILVDLLGLDKLTNAFGWILLFEGVASLIGAPIAGWIADACNPSYNESFVFCGALICISGLMLYPLPCIQRTMNKRKMKNAQPLNPVL